MSEKKYWVVTWHNPDHDTYSCEPSDSLCEDIKTNKGWFPIMVHEITKAEYDLLEGPLWSSP